MRSEARQQVAALLEDHDVVAELVERPCRRRATGAGADDDHRRLAHLASSPLRRSHQRSRAARWPPRCGANVWSSAAFGWLAGGSESAVDTCSGVKPFG